MAEFKNMFIALNFILLIFFVLSESGSEMDDGEAKKTNSAEDDSNKEDLETISPIELKKLEEKILDSQAENAEKFGLPFTNSPKEVETFLKAEEKEYGKELPDKVEEVITDGGDVKNFVNFVELFNKIELENSEKEQQIIEKSPEEMKKMKEELYEVTNKINEQYDLPKIPREEFNAVWKQKKEEYGEYFPYKIERLITTLKKTENEEIATTVNEISETTSETPPLITEPPTEEPPKNVFSVRNAKDHICILAKFHSVITIGYAGRDSEQKVEVTVPHTAHTKGKCGSPNRFLQVSWETFAFTLHFNKSSEDFWSATSVELSYDTSQPLFDGAANHEKVTAKSKILNLFETPYGKSYFCPAQEVILLYHKDKHVATVRMKEVHIQPYEVEDGKFSTNYRCDKVVIGGPDEEIFVPDETVPLAVGCTLALITLLILVGFSVHRAYNAAKPDYNSME